MATSTIKPALNATRPPRCARKRFHGESVFSWEFMAHRKMGSLGLTVVSGFDDVNEDE